MNNTKNFYLLVNEYGNDRKAGCMCVCIQHNKRICTDQFRKKGLFNGMDNTAQYNAQKFINEDILLRANK